MKWLAFLFALLLLLGAMLLKAPATWLDHGLQQASRGALGLADGEGSLWRGQGNLQAILPSGDVGNLARVAWHLEPSALLRGGLRLVMTRESDGTPVIDIFVAPSGWTLHRLHGEVPASLLGAFSTTMRDLGLSGRLTFDLRDVGMAGGQVRGDGFVVWSAAGSNLTRLHPLGDYRLELRGLGPTLDYRLTTLGGKLRLSGEGGWRPGANPSFRGEAVPASEHRAELAPLLRILGRENGAGYTLVLDANMGVAAR